jgi:hypothetical protein
MSIHFYKTQWIPLKNNLNKNHFILISFFYFLCTLFFKIFLRRTVLDVRSSYDKSRTLLLNNLIKLSFDDYVFFPKSFKDFYLKDHQVHYGPLRIPRKILLSKLENFVSNLHSQEGVIIEIGSGDGRNLLYLKKKFPNFNFIGFELSPKSVELSKVAANKFKIDNVDFICADATTELLINKKYKQNEILLVYTSFALEMMPRIYKLAVENIFNLNAKNIIFYEPDHKQIPYNFRGITSRIRVLNLDRLSGLINYLNMYSRNFGYTITYNKPSGVGINPLNEMTEIRLIKT